MTKYLTNIYLEDICKINHDMDVLSQSFSVLAITRFLDKNTYDINGRALIMIKILLTSCSSDAM